MIYFSNMTAEEFIRTNGDAIPTGMVSAFEEMQAKIAMLESEIAEQRRTIEVVPVQQYFAQELVKELDLYIEETIYSEGSCSKAAHIRIKKGYDAIRAETSFEV